LLQGLQIPSRIEACSVMEETPASTIIGGSATMGSKQSVLFLTNHWHQTLNRGGLNNGNTAFSVSDFDVL